MLHIGIEEATPQAYRILGDGLDGYNRTASRRQTNTSEFIVALRDDQAALVGGILANVYLQALFIEWLWISEQMRGTGYGRRLMDCVEAEGRQSGAVMAYLDTFDFQAPGFYEKRGYRNFGTLPYEHLGLKRFYLTKEL